MARDLENFEAAEHFAAGIEGFKKVVNNARTANADLKRSPLQPSDDVLQSPGGFPQVRTRSLNSSSIQGESK